MQNIETSDKYNMVTEEKLRAIRRKNNTQNNFSEDDTRKKSECFS